MKQKVALFIHLLLIWSISSVGQLKKETTTLKVDIQSDTVANITKPQKSVTEGTVSIEGKPINYQAIAGTLILKNTNDTPTCSMFYVAYFKEGVGDKSR
jgi:carboxypeptidase C (cathepsin A)